MINHWPVLTLHEHATLMKLWTERLNPRDLGFIYIFWLGRTESEEIQNKPYGNYENKNQQSVYRKKVARKETLVRTKI